MYVTYRMLDSLILFMFNLPWDLYFASKNHDRVCD